MKKLSIIFMLISSPFMSHSQNDTLPNLEPYFSALIVNDIDSFPSFGIQTFWDLLS